MTTILLALLLSAGVGTEAFHPTQLTANQPALAERCKELADQPTFDFPISLELGVDVGYVFKPIEHVDERIFSFSIATTR